MAEAGNGPQAAAVVADAAEAPQVPQGTAKPFLAGYVDSVTGVLVENGAYAASAHAFLQTFLGLSESFVTPSTFRGSPASFGTAVLFLIQHQPKLIFINSNENRAALKGAIDFLTESECAKLKAMIVTSTAKDLYGELGPVTSEADTRAAYARCRDLFRLF